MSQWDDKFKSHAIHATLGNLEDRLTDESLKTDDLSVIEHLDRIAQLKLYAETCLESLIPALVNHGHLNNTNSYIESIIAELNNYIANRNVAHLNNTSSHIDNAMAQLIALPMQSFPISKQSFTKSLLQFKSLAEESLLEIKGSKDTLQASIAEISEDAINQKTDAQGILDILEEKKADASNLLQIIGNIGITGNYQNIANLEKAAADKWRNIALGLMISMVAVIGFTIFISATNGFDWKLALFRVGAALALAIPAAYAAKESAKHRLLENHNRRSELELASLDPYLEKLPEDTRNKVKEELTKKFFGLNFQEHKAEEPVSSAAIFDLLKTAVSKK